MANVTFNTARNNEIVFTCVRTHAQMHRLWLYDTALHSTAITDVVTSTVQAVEKRRHHVQKPQRFSLTTSDKRVKKRDMLTMPPFKMQNASQHL